MKDDDTESRKAFEKWMCSIGYVNFTRWRDDDRPSMIGKYGVEKIQLAWEAWCAAIKYWDEQINKFSDQPPCSKPKP